MGSGNMSLEIPCRALRIVGYYYIAPICAATYLIDKIDFYLCARMEEMNVILDKLIDVAVPEALEKKYLFSQSIVLSDIIGDDMWSQTYMSERSRPLCVKLNFLCRKLKKRKSSSSNHSIRSCSV